MNTCWQPGFRAVAARLGSRTASLFRRRLQTFFRCGLNCDLCVPSFSYGRFSACHIGLRCWQFRLPGTFFVCLIFFYFGEIFLITFLYSHVSQVRTVVLTSGLHLHHVKSYLMILLLLLLIMMMMLYVCVYRWRVVVSRCSMKWFANCDSLSPTTLTSNTLTFAEPPWVSIELPFSTAGHVTCRYPTKSSCIDCMSTLIILIDSTLSALRKLEFLLFIYLAALPECRVMESLHWALPGDGYCVGNKGTGCGAHWSVHLLVILSCNSSRQVVA